MQWQGCRALTNLSCGGDECRKAVRDAGGANALMLAMEMHPEDLPLARLRLAPCIARTHARPHAAHARAPATPVPARPGDAVAGTARRPCATWARLGWHRGSACAARGARNPVRRLPLVHLPLMHRTDSPAHPPRGSWVLPHTAEELAAVGIGSLLEAVELLLRFHPDDVDGPHGPAGCSLLQHAVRHGLRLLARRLLLRGADPSLAVHLAADCGQVAMVRLLLQWGAPLDALDERGVTMLSKARGRGAAESGREVASLLESSAKAAQELREASRAVISLLPKQARAPPRGIVASLTLALPPNGLVGERASSGTVRATAQASAQAYACALCMCTCACASACCAQAAPPLPAPRVRAGRRSPASEQDECGDACATPERLAPRRRHP